MVQKGKILVVDDNDKTRETVVDILKLEGYEDILTANNGTEGIEVAKQQRPDLILMDVMMPQMAGGEVVRLLQSEEKTKYIPVIFLTGIVKGGDEEVEALNINNEFYTVMGKPFEPQKLLSEVKRVLSEGA